MNEGRKKNRDWFAVIVILINPLMFLFVFSTKSSLPDTYAYIAQAENIVNNLLFYTGPWGHVDSSLILAPLYPSLIALLMKMGIDGLNAAIYISLLSGILFSVFSYYFIRTVARPFVAIAAVVAMNSTYIYFNFFTTALSESIFLLALLGAIIASTLMLSNISENKYMDAFIAGFVCSIAFLAREIGVAIFLAISIIFVFYYFFLGKEKHSVVLKKAGIFILGFVILVLPYQSIRMFQTDASPFTQSYRLEEYIVSVDSSEIISNIEKYKNIMSLSLDYEDIYIVRRNLMELLPDSSEMLSYVVYNEGNSVVSNTPEKITKYSSNFIHNMEYLVENIGYGILILFILSCITIFIPRQSKLHAQRIIIPVFLIVYIALISYFTGEIPRYIEVIVPFIWLHLCIELNLSFKLIDNKYIKTVYLNMLLILLCPAIVFAGSPNLFYAKKIFSPNPKLEEKLGELRKIINTEPVFTQFPALAFDVGGKYRQLPNDSLEKVVRYGNLTGVSWLLVVDVPEQRDAMQYWHKAYTWITAGNLEYKYPKLVSYCCGLHDDVSESDWRLYQLHLIN